MRGFALERLPDRGRSARRRLVDFALVLSLAAGIGACNPGTGARDGDSAAPDTGGAEATSPSLSVRGTATYRERIALRPGSVLAVDLIDVSRADAPGTTLASYRAEDPGSPPFPFEISVAADAIEANARYVVRATITTAGTLLMSTDTAYPVLTQGAGNEVELLLRSVPRGDAAPALGALPASFAGVLPCADCPGIRYRLNLRADSSYELRLEYLERDGTTDTLGSYAVDAGSGTLALWSEAMSRRRFRILDAGTLRLLDINGNDIVSGLNYELERQPAFEPLELELALRGMFTYFADAGRFVECESGRDFAVAQEADNAALERAYVELRRAPGDALLAGFDGRVMLRPPVEGSGLQPTVVVERFDGVWPAETCGARMSESDTLGSNWVLTRIGAEPVVLADGEREPRFVLAATGGTVSGSGGCNEFSGGYELSGQSISFGPLAATLRACVSGGDYETRLFEALGAAASLQRTRHHLELFDAGGGRLARFEARALQ